CVAEALSGPGGPGPVHCNLAFRDPLLGHGGGVVAPPGRSDGAPWHSRTGSSGGDAPVSLIERLAPYAGRRGVVVAGGGAAGGAGPGAATPGAGDPAPLIEAARGLGWSVFADPRSGCRLPADPVVAAADALLRVPEVAAWRPDVVLRLGAPWASKVLTQWL